MKHLKQKLMATLAMLLVSSVMLTSASFAWFTISTAPEVQNITTTVTANENLEIALGTTLDAEPAVTGVTDSTAANKNHTWGALVAFPETALTGLGPVVINGGALQTVKYGTDGRPNGYENVTAADFNAVTDGVDTFADPNGNIVGQTVILWFRTNKAGTLQVAINESDITIPSDWTSIDDPSSTTTPKAKTDTSIVRVAFQVVGTDTVVEAVTDAGDTAKRVANITGLTINTPTQVYMHVYLDGAKVSNAHVDPVIAGGNDTNVVGIKEITFTNSNIVTTNNTNTYTPTSGN